MLSVENPQEEQKTQCTHFLFKVQFFHYFLAEENRKRVIKMARLGGGGNAYIQCFWCREKFLLVKLVADSLL